MLEGEAAATCSLVGDFSLGTSYGSMPCNLCPSSQPMCLVSDSSSGGSGSAVAVGVCACMQQRQPFQSCSNVNMGMRVVPDASQLCAASLHAGASSRSTSALYDWNFLVAAPCVLISMGNAYCYKVSGYGFMVVGHGIVRTTSSLQLGGAGSRRLLQAGERSSANEQHGIRWEDRMAAVGKSLDSFSSGWGHVHDPCKTLASEFRRAAEAAPNMSSPYHAMRMSFTDVLVLEDCVSRRMVGRDMTSALNLTSMGSHVNGTDCCSHIFMSVHDFIHVVGTQKGVGLELMHRAPDVGSFWVRSTSLYSSLLQVVDTVKQHAIVMYLDSLWESMLHDNNSTFASANKTTWRHGNATEKAIMRRFIAQHKVQIALFDAYMHETMSRMPSNLSAVPLRTGKHIRLADENITTDPVHAKGGGGSRSLLQDQGVQGNVVDAYSSLVASTQGFSNLAVASSKAAGVGGIPLVTETWLEGPFGWPPR